ncbi:hypothetical protein KJ708_12000 [bacterium]|nr:hypothetical protein [bacterium]
MTFRLVTTSLVPQAHFPFQVGLPTVSSLPPRSRGVIQLPHAKVIMLRRAPDGDTLGVDFRSTGLFGTRVKNTCRYLNMDTRESHFEDKGQLGADEQTDANLLGIGARNVRWSSGRGEILSFEPRDLSVRVLTNGKGNYGRVLGMPIRHDADIEGLITGDQVDWHDPHFVKLIEATVNYDMVRAGQANATFYKGVSPVEIVMFLSASHYAKEQKLGIWADGQDHTYTGFYVHTLDDLLGESSKIHPVIFRRMISYMQRHGTFSDKAFINSLSEHPDKLQRIKDDYMGAHPDTVRGMEVEDVFDGKEYFLHDLFEIEKASNGRPGFIVRITESLDRYVRW